MDKVIIDGVDVSGCEFAGKAKNDNRIKCHCAKGLLQITKMQEQPESIKSGLCENNPDCYYKKLQRLKEELRTEKIYSSQIEELEESLQHAKAENKELSEENSKLKGKLDAYKMSENEANEIIVELKAENEQLKVNKGSCAFKCLDNTFCPEADKKITELELSRDSYKVSYETAKKYREKAEKVLQEIRDKLDFHKQELEECLYNPIDDEIREIINSVIGTEE